MSTSSTSRSSSRTRSSGNHHRFVPTTTSHRRNFLNSSSPASASTSASTTSSSTPENISSKQNSQQQQRSQRSTTSATTNLSSNTITSSNITNPKITPSTATSAWTSHRVGGGGGVGVGSNSVNGTDPKIKPTSTSAPLSSTTKSLHPLRHVWSVSFVHREPGQRVNDDLWAVERLAEMGSIESYWAVWSHLVRPSQLPSISEYYIFKSHINPTWEDPNNASGGKWVVRLKKGVADRLWEEIVMALLGERFFSENDPDSSSDDICGCVISVRRDEDLLSVWHSDSSSPEKKERLQNALRKCLNFDENTVLTYRVNGEQAQVDNKRRINRNQ